MSEIKIGDVRRLRRGDGTYEVIALFEDYVWIKSESFSIPESVSLKWVENWSDPVPDFFEEGKVYQHKGTHNKVLVDKIIHAPSGQFALVTSMNPTPGRDAGDPRILGEHGWSDWQEQ